MIRSCPQAAILCVWLVCGATTLSAQERGGGELPPPPTSITVVDHPGDDGTQIDVTFGLPADGKEEVSYYLVLVSGSKEGFYDASAPIVPTEDHLEVGEVTFRVEKLLRGADYFAGVCSVRVGEPGTEPLQSVAIFAEESVTPVLNGFDIEKAWFLGILVLVCSSVILFVFIARTGRELKVRKIAGLEAVDEAVGRATEMGKSCVFVPGIMDINDIQTVAAITVLSRVAETAADYDAKVEVPTSKSLVMTTARETVQASFLQAGRPDAYNQDLIYYVTDEQFGYVAYLSGMMVRDEPAACFYMGSFFAESLILAETGNSIGAIQVAGTAQPAQLPFFVAACDYTLIGEEFFAASAYLSGDPDQLGSLKGQDVGKIFVAIVLFFGCFIASVAQFFPEYEVWLSFLKDVVLK